MATASQIRDRVRTELGDTPEPFRTSVRGNGEQVDFELEAEHILENTDEVFRINADGTLTNFIQLDTSVTAPTLNAPTGSTSGGTLPAGTYYYRLSALTSLGETSRGNEVSRVTTGATSVVNHSWTAVVGATGYKLYRGVVAGSEDVLVATLGAVTSYTDTGAATTAADTRYYTIDLANGTVHFTVAPDLDETIIIEGSSYAIFTDAELDQFVADAAAQHMAGQIVQTRYRDGHGFIQYLRVPMTLDTLPEQEEILVALLATVEAMWALSVDASTDIDISSSEGTTIPRTQRFRQIVAETEMLKDRYKELSMLMGVGIYRPEIFTLRRVSRTTGRLVPVFIDREYDEAGPPVRALPPIQERDADPDGPASPWYPSGYGP